MKKGLWKLLGIISVFGLLTNCEKEDLGENQTRNFELEAFSQISFKTIGIINLHQGNEFRIEIETNELLFDNFIISVEEEKLIVKSSFSSKETEEIKLLNIHVYAPTFTSIEMDGVSNITSREGIVTDNLELILKGVGDMHIRNIQVNSLTIVQQGVGNIVVTGNTGRANFRLLSNGDIQSFELNTKRATASIEGLGDIELLVENRLDANITGLGNIYYKGNPLISSSITGIGRLVNAN